jgi:hypothetical protein
MVGHGFDLSDADDVVNRRADDQYFHYIQFHLSFKPCIRNSRTSHLFRSIACAILQTSNAGAQVFVTLGTALGKDVVLHDTIGVVTQFNDIGIAAFTQNITLLEYYVPSERCHRASP